MEIKTVDNLNYKDLMTSEIVLTTFKINFFYFNSDRDNKENQIIFKS